MVSYIYNPSTWGGRGKKDYYRFKTSLDYTVKSRNEDKARTGPAGKDTYNQPDSLSLTESTW